MPHGETSCPEGYTVGGVKEHHGLFVDNCHELLAFGALYDVGWATRPIAGEVQNALITHRYILTV